jgi:DNA repair/transcription protein MET18/MMS19
MGEISLLGVVDIMTGEKDPRNLMIVFSILKVIMVEWDISNHVEVCVISPRYRTPLTLDRPFSIPYITTSQSHFDPHPTTPMESQHKI